MPDRCLSPINPRTFDFIQLSLGNVNGFQPPLLAQVGLQPCVEVTRHPHREGIKGSIECWEKVLGGPVKQEVSGVHGLANDQ